MTVYVSVPTVDEDAWRTLEPGTAHPLQRLRAVRELVDAGIDAGVLMAPIVPGISSHPDKLERTIKAIADSGARLVGAKVLHPRRRHARPLHALPGAASFPRWPTATSSSTPAKYAPKDYTQRVQQVVGLLKARYGLPERKRRAEM